MADGNDTDSSMEEPKDTWQDMLSEMSTVMGDIDYDEIDPADWTNFGLMNSHIYRENFLKLVKDKKLTQKSILMVVVLCTVVRSKKRILKNIDKFKSKSWFAQVKKFISENIVQSPSEAKTASQFPVVNVSSCMPTLAALVWARFTAKPTVELMIGNLWFGQLWLNDEAQAANKAWEQHFWTNIVTKGSANYEKGFHEDYYQKKVDDKYPLAKKDLTFFPPSDEFTGYSMDDLNKWLKEVTA